MKTHLRVVFILLLLHFSLSGQDYLQWKSIDRFEHFKKYSDTISCLPQGQARVISKSIQNNALRKNDSLLYANALLLEGDVNFRIGRLNLAEAQYNEALVIFEKLNTTNYIALSLIKLAALNHVEGNSFQALNRLQKSLSLPIDSFPYFKALAYYNVSRIHASQHEYALALKTLEEVTSYCNDSSECSSSFLNAVEVQRSLLAVKFGNWREAELLLSQLKQLTPKPEYNYNVAYAKSVLWLEVGNFKKADTEAQKGFQYALKCSSPQLQAEILLQQARVHAASEDFKKAIEYAQKSLSALNEMDVAPSLRIQILDALSKFYVDNKDSSSALLTLISLKDFQDSISALQPNSYVVQTESNTEKTPPPPHKPDTLKSQIQKTPLIVIKGNREKIIIGIISVIIIGLIVGLIPLFKLKQDAKNAKILKANIDKLKETELELGKQLSLSKEEIKRLEELDNNKNKVFSVLTHDIRQPINQVKSVLELLSEQSLSVEDRKEIIQRLRESLDNSNHALENLLLWSKKQLTGINSKMVDVHLLPQVWQLESLIKESLDAKRIKLEIKVPDFFKVYADMNQLDICLRNLVNNAIKFSNRGGTITIDALQNGNSKIVRVMDNGVGMTEEQVEKLMTLKGDFSTIGTMNEKGTGLGILIVKEFMENQQGHLEITSQKGQGSVFSLVFNGKRPK